MVYEQKAVGYSYYAYTYNDSSTQNSTIYFSGQVKTTSFSAYNFSTYNFYDIYNYTYYPNGNLKTMVGPGLNVEYVYDQYNRLSIENNYLSGIGYEYSYDSGGNISLKSCYVINGNYISSGGFYYTNMWKDQLTAFDGGYNITYDEAGNPTLYKGASLTWTNGRQLASYTASWGSNANYTYDYAGIRTSKTVDGVTTKYFVQGDRILAEKTGSELTWYYYDETGVCGMQYQGVNYIFEKNILGDVVAIYRVSDGMYMGRYTYNNAWGFAPGTSSNVTVAGSSAVLNANPFRYRSYYFDKETCLYYLNSRYYDPQTGRFINADEPSTLLQSAGMNGGANLYAYCLNNPISYTDSTGQFFLFDWIGAGAKAVGSAASAAGNFVADNWQAVVGCAVIAGLTAATILTSGACAPLLLATVGAYAGAGAGVVANLITSGGNGWQSAFMYGAISGAINGAFGQAGFLAGVGIGAGVAMGTYLTKAAFGGGFTWAGLGVTGLFGGIAGMLPGNTWLTQIISGAGIGTALELAEYYTDRQVNQWVYGSLFMPLNRNIAILYGM